MKDSLLRYVLLLIIFLIILLNRIAVPGFNSISISMIFLYFLLFVTYILNISIIDRAQFIKFLLLIFSLVVASLFSSGYSLYNSEYLGLILVLIFNFIFLFKIKKMDDSFYNGFYNILFLFVLFGLIQYVFYGFLGKYIDLSNYIDENYLIKGYNSSNGGEGLDYRVNGFFFLEPSFFSQFCGLYIILEHLYRGYSKYFRLSLAVIIMVLNGSGTGFILLFSYIILLYIKVNKLKNFLVNTIILIIGILLVLLVVKYNYNLSYYFSSRISTEFGMNAESSFNFRFVIPYIMTWDYILTSNIYELIFGNGPITTSEVMNTGKDGANFTAILVSLFEYGIIFSIFYFYYILGFIKKIGFFNAIIPIFIMFFILSSTFYQSYSVILLWLVCNLLIWKKTE